jgi:ligand-binding SRPBCC domain-containing protein
VRRRLVPGLLLGAGLLLSERFWSRPARYTLDRTQLVHARREQLFDFFVDPRNLPHITPPWIHFEIVQVEQSPLAGGTMQEYRIRWLGVPLSWETLIAEFEHGRRFTDVQTRGPYRYWRHEHTFEDAGDATLVRDRVQYQLPFGLLGRFAHALLVRRQLAAIFDYRARIIEEVFGR